MESTNLTETHQTEDVSKVKANYVECPSCDVRAHVQPNFCRAYYPPPQRCRACVENCEDITLPQPCFLNPQFLQPAFHTGSLSQSHCCNHDRISSEPKIRDHAIHERERMRQTGASQVFCQKMKKKSVWGTVDEKNGASRNEPSHLPKCQNQARAPQWNYRPCSCGEPLPWASGPFFIPLMPYCVFWHPQNPSNYCSNYYGGQLDNLNRNVEGAGDALNTENQEKHLEVENDCEQEDCSEDDKSKKEMDKEHNKSSSSFLSLRSFTRDEKRRCIKKKSSSPSMKDRSDVNSDEEEAEEVDVRRSVSSNNSQNRYEHKSNENIHSNTVDDCDDYSVANDSKQTSTTASEYDLKAEDSSAEANETDDQAKFEDMSVEENDIHDSPSNSLESIEEKDSKEYNHISVGFCISKSRMTPKKLIKNFTVTNRMESETQEKSQILAGGGDLGGDNCTGFKVNIEPEDVPFESVREDSLEDNSEPKRPPLKGTEENKSNNLPPDPKTLRTSRTGIARLIQDSKQRDTKMDDAKNVKREPDSSDVKCRRLVNEKEKSSKVTRQQKTGLEKRNQISNPNGRPSKKEENLSSRQTRSATTRK